MFFEKNFSNVVVLVFLEKKNEKAIGRSQKEKKVHLQYFVELVQILQ